MAGCAILFQNSSFQTWLAQRVALKISEAIGAPVRIDGIRIDFFDHAHIEGFYVEDLHGDTLLYASSIDADFDDVYLGFSHFDFDRLVLKDGQFNVRQFAGEDDLNIQFILDHLKSPKAPGDTSKSSPPEIFIWNVELEKIDFTYEYRDSTEDTSAGMNVDHIRIQDIYAELNRFLIIDDSLSGEIKHMRCKEYKGYEVLDMSSEFIVAYTTMDFANLKIKTPKSYFSGRVHFDYDSYDELSDFIEEVQMRGTIKESSIDLNELSYFSSDLIGFNEKVNISGDFKGRVDYLTGRNVTISLFDSTKFQGNFLFQGLPDTDVMSYRIDAREISSTRSNLQRIPAYPFASGEKLGIPDELDAFGLIQYTGKISGNLNDTRFDGVLLTDAGDIDTDLRLWYNSSIQDYAYNGLFSTPNTHLEKVVKSSPQPGLISLELKIDGSGFSESTLNTSVIASISELQIDQYILKGISIDATIKNQTYDGVVRLNDPNLRMTLAGLLDLSKENASGDFHANIDRMDVTALGLVRRDSSLVFSTEITTGFTGNSIDEMRGQIELAQSAVRLGTKRYTIDDILLEVTGPSYNREVSLFSDIADASLKGEFKLSQLPDAVLHVVNSFIPSYTKIQTNYKIQDQAQQFSYFVNLKQTELLSDLFVPSIRVPKPATISGEFSDVRNLIKLDASLPVLDIEGLEFHGFTANAETNGSRLGLVAKTRRLMVDDSVNINFIEFNANTVTDQVDFSLNWASRSDLKAPDAKLNAHAGFSGSRIDLQLLPSLILISDTLWQVNEENSIVVDSGKVVFRNLSFIHGTEFVRLDGPISSNSSDELDIILDNFQLRNINPFIENDGVRLQGSAKGIISVSNLFSKPFFKSNIQLGEVTINEDLVGDASIVSKWDAENQRILLDAQILANGVPKLKLNGYYIPSKKENNMRINATMNNVQISFFKPYVTDLFSDMSGLLDGQILLTGSLFKPVAEGTINLKRTAVTVDILNTRYFLSHEFEVKNNLIQASNIVVTDENAHTGKLDIKIKHDYFDDFQFDIQLKANNLMALNTTAANSDLFYGKAFATGTFKATGPLDNIVMNISAKTEKGTVFYLPLSGTSDVSQQDFITFVSKDSSNSSIKEKQRVPESKGYELYFNLEVTPDAEALLLFDPKVGDMIKGNGNANLRMEVTEAGEFNMYGDYIINNGDYLFTLQNVINKKFVVQKGGLISFKGDPYDADIDLKAIYKVRTSLYNLVKNIDSSASVKQTIDVDAIMNLSDKLMKPTIYFDIRLPNSDEATRNLLRSQIMNDDDLNRQIFALVMFRSFWPNQGGANETTSLGGVGSNASELVSSQLGNMLSQLSDDVNIGVNYSQGGADARDQVSVNMSTQMFNDRVSIDGNVGTSSNTSTTGNTSNMVGEFNIEIKVTEDGAVRIKVFNRSNQYLLVTNDVPYTQGVGLFYRKESDNFGDIFKRK